jgi:hypothetical protein
MNNIPKPLFSKTVRSAGQLYFLDVYEGRRGNVYLSICENRMDRQGNAIRIRIFIERDALPEMCDAMNEVARFLKSRDAEKQKRGK